MTATKGERQKLPRLIMLAQACGRLGEFVQDQAEKLVTRLKLVDFDVLVHHEDPALNVSFSGGADLHSAAPRAARVPLPIPIMYRRAGEDMWFQSTIVNLSDSGVLFGPAESVMFGASDELPRPEHVYGRSLA